MAEPNDRNIALTQRDCNWLQALEGDVDTSHLGFLHAGCVDPSRMDPNDAATYTVLNKAPQINISEMPFGTMYSASREAMAGHEHHRFASFIFPVLGRAIRATGWNGICRLTPGCRSMTSTP